METGCMNKNPILKYRVAILLPPHTHLTRMSFKSIKYQNKVFINSSSIILANLKVLTDALSCSGQQKKL